MFLFRRANATNETSQGPVHKLIARLEHLRLDGTVKVGSIVGFGGYADVYRGTLRMRRTKDVKKVAIKKCRIIFTKEEEEFVESFERETLIWKTLDHDNVLRLLGIMTMEDIPCLVSEWMENGTMNMYLKDHEGVNLLELVRGIACGLEYLHSCEVIHSDMRGDNILISADGRAVLSDFGTSRLLKNSVTIAGTQTFKGCARWTAPELFQPSDEPLKHLFHTKASDVWAFGMVVYEALFREVPFRSCQNELQVMSSVIGGALPSKPEGADTGMEDLMLLWYCCQRCWDYKPTSRPSMQVLRTLLTANMLLVERTRAVPNVLCWLSPTGLLIAIKADDNCSIILLETRTMNRLGAELTTDSEVWALAWSSSELHIVTRSYDGVLHKWSNILKAPILVARSTQDHKEARLSYSSDDRFIASVSDSKAKVWNASDLSLLWECSGEWFQSVAFHPSGQKVFFFRGEPFIEVKVGDLGEVTTTEHKRDYRTYRLVFYPDGSSCVADTDKGVKILCGKTYQEKMSLPYYDCEALGITPKEKYILLVLESNKLILWDISAGRSVEELTLDADLDGMWSAEIATSCRVLRLRGSNQSFIVHLMSTYY